MDFRWDICWPSACIGASGASRCNRRIGATLWRGVYVTLFADNVWLNTIYPSLAFGLWHLCPLSVAPSRHPGGGLAFVGYAFVLGLLYAYAARRTRSITWSSLLHQIQEPQPNRIGERTKHEVDAVLRGGRHLIFV